MPEFDNMTVEQILFFLDENNHLFPQFGLAKINNGLKLLGGGGFSSVYEMYNKERPEISFAIKVIGLEKHTVSSGEFKSTSRIQFMLAQESPYIVRVLDAKELVIVFDESGRVQEVKDATKESWEEEDNCLRLQVVLMEKLDVLLSKDRFQNVSLLVDSLRDESEVIKFAFQIGHALNVAHNNKILHRDIKLENIFWDNEQKIYKLGDFGIAKYAEDGTAETIVYTDGYGAPEIERRLYDYYNVTADIYSLGITLYLLLNELRFPGSDGYYPKVNVQYDPDFVFPAPVNASTGMTRIIRKMCSFNADDRYQTMLEVLNDLMIISEGQQNDFSDEIYDLMDMVTETYSEPVEENEHNEKSNNKDDNKDSNKSKELTRAERKYEQHLIDKLYRNDSIRYFISFLVTTFILLKGIQPDNTIANVSMFWVIVGMVFFEGILQRFKEFHILFGIGTLVMLGLSISRYGLTVPHILMIFCVLLGGSILTTSVATATGLWILVSVNEKMKFLDFLGTHDLGWIILIIFLVMVYRYFYMQNVWEKISPFKYVVIQAGYDKSLILMAIAGIVLLILQKCNVFVIPDIITRIHMIRVGIISFIIMCIFAGIEMDEESQNEKEILHEMLLSQDSDEEL